MYEPETIGVSFEFSHEYLNHFAQLFENISIEKYTWYVSCSENFMSHGGKVDLFLPNGVYCGEEFASIIRSTPEYYIHLISLYAVPNGNKFDSDEIATYQDYIRSSAEIALLSADSFADLYVKDFNTLKVIYDSCMKYYSNGAIPLEYITPQNDARTGFYV